MQQTGSAPPELTLLAIGDVHLGTRPSSLPDGLAEAGVDPRALTPEAALGEAVDLAIAERVDAVLFAGDVVESTNARFEALRPLEAAVRRLLDANIPVLGVVGNHDVEALPRLARLIAGFELIGEGGRWETHVIEKNGVPAAEILGWSFPEAHVRHSPLAELNRNPIARTHAGICRIGLLHGDLDASGGDYAPFTSTELNQAGADAWLLGHIHKPSLPEGASGDGSGPRGYLGSLTGRHPGEMGAHGPWLVRVTAAGEVIPRHVMNAALRWEQFDLQVAEDETPDDLGDRLLEEAVRFAKEIQNQGSTPEVLGLRPRLLGPTRHYEQIDRYITQNVWKGSMRQAGNTLVFIDKVHNGLELAIDLEDIAQGDDPPALLAGKLLALEHSGLERDSLLEQARAELKPLASEPRWSGLHDLPDAPDPLSDDALVALLLKSGTTALQNLLSQRDDHSQQGRVSVEGDA